jgi:hypothetical protein
MYDNYYPELVPAERLQMLQANADNIVKGQLYQRPLTEEELAGIREDYVKDAIQLAKLEDEKKALTEAITMQMKPLKVEQAVRLQKMKHRQETLEDDIYEVFDFQQRIAVQYNSKGEWVGTRRMRPEEREPNMFAISHNKTAEQ